MNIEVLDLNSGQPLYKQVADRIFKYIKVMDLNEGDQIPTPRQFGRELNVNELTVRRGMKLLIERGVLCSVKGKGTFVSSRVSAKTILWIFGVDAVNGIAEFERKIFLHGRSVLEKEGYIVDVCWSSIEDAVSHRKICAQISSFEYEGIVLGCCSPGHPVLAYVRQNMFKFIWYTDHIDSLNCVGMDIAQSYEIAFDIMTKRKHSEVTVICRRSQETPHSEVEAKLWSFMADTAEFKLNVVSIFLSKSLEYVGYEVANELLGSSKLGRALIVADYQLAQGVSRAILAKGYKNIDDFLVFSRDDRDFPLGLPVAYIGSSITGEAERGIKLLLKQIKGEKISVRDIYLRQNVRYK